jgi:hypothetical protein
LEVPREEDRGPAYGKFLDAALKEPSIIGVHLFEYLDEPLTGRVLDGENGHFGLVTITDLPYQGFVGAVRKSNLAALDKLRQLTPAPVPVPVPIAEIHEGAGAEHGAEHSGPGGHGGKGGGTH